MSLTYSVKIGGIEVKGITLDGASTTYGRTDPGEAISPPVCNLELITDDTLDPWTVLYDLAEVTIDVTTESGYVDTYEANYKGATFRRFTGHIISMEFDPAANRAKVGLVGNLEKAARRFANVSGYSAQNDVDRISTMLTAAGMTYTIEGTSSVTFAAKTAAPTNFLPLLSDYVNHASGFLYEKTDGTILYRAANGTRGLSGSIPAESIPVDGIDLRREAGTVVNSVVVSYGTASPQATVTVNDTGSQALYGVRQKSITTELSALVDANALATVQLANYYAPHWSMPDVSIRLNDLRLEDLSRVMGLKIGDIINIPNLPADSPIPSYTSTLLGWTENLSLDEWEISFHLASEGYTQAAITWADVPAGTAKKWSNVTAGVTWAQALTRAKIGI